MRKQFNNLDFGPIIPMGPSEFGKAPAFPKAGEHPRLIFTKDMIPNIKRVLEDPRFDSFTKTVKESAKAEFDGILPAPYYHETDRRGLHNYDIKDLEIIASKAFMYAVWGDKELAYQAIDAMQNYLLTINIRFIFCGNARRLSLRHSTSRILLRRCKLYDRSRGIGRRR